MRKQIWITGVVAASLLVLASASDWTGWRGPNRDGKSDETGLLKKWPAGGPKKLWTAKVGGGYSSAAICGKQVFATGITEKELILTAWSLEGKKDWSVKVGRGFVKSYAGSRGTPTVNDGFVYIESGHGIIAAFDTKEGKKKWSRKLSEFGGVAHRWGFSESVLVVGDNVIVTPGGRAGLVALNKKTGQDAWKSQRFGQAHYSSPIYVEYQKVPMIIQGTSAGLIALNPENGKTLWTHTALKSMGACPTPAFENGVVFWALGYNAGCVGLQLSVNGQKVSVKELFLNKNMICHHGGYILHEGYAYGNHNNGWVCLDLKTGAKKWESRGPGKGSICFADGMLYLFGEKGGRIELVEAKPEKFTSAGKFSADGSGASWAHPVVSGGRLYLRYGNNLHCYDIKAK